MFQHIGMAHTDSIGSQARKRRSNVMKISWYIHAGSTYCFKGRHATLANSDVWNVDIFRLNDYDSPVH